MKLGLMPKDRRPLTAQTLDQRPGLRCRKRGNDDQIGPANGLFDRGKANIPVRDEPDHPLNARQSTIIDQPELPFVPEHADHRHCLKHQRNTIEDRNAAPAIEQDQRAVVAAQKERVEAIPTHVGGGDIIGQAMLIEHGSSTRS
jgi:hypothetical protein